jgi:TPR repeat protein
MYQEGKYVKVDYDAAVRWLTPAAMAGDARAQYDLARAWYAGEGVPRDARRGFAWNWLAARRGYEFAQQQLQNISRSLPYDEQVQGRQAAEKWQIGRDIVLPDKPVGYGGLSAFNLNAPFSPGH